MPGRSMMLSAWILMSCSDLPGFRIGAGIPVDHQIAEGNLQGFVAFPVVILPDELAPVLKRLRPVRLPSPDGAAGNGFGIGVQENLFRIKAQADAEVLGLVISVDRMERGRDTEKSALKAIGEKYGMKTASIVTMQEVVACLHNKEYNGRVVIDDAMKEAIDRYYETYGAR